LIKAIHEKGWLVNKKKSCSEPTRRVEWLGKDLRITKEGIQVQVANGTLVNIIILFLWVTSRQYAQIVMRSFLGLVSWAGIHTRLALPFLHSSHCFLNGPRQKFPPQQVRQQLSKALGSLFTSVKAPVVLPAGFARQELPWLYADAAAEEGWGGLVLDDARGEVHWKAFKLPGVFCGEENQQVAELFAARRAVQWARSWQVKRFVLMLDNLSSAYSARKMSTGVANKRRAKLLRQLAVAIDDPHDPTSEQQMTVFLAHIPGVLMPADFPSRPCKYAGMEDYVRMQILGLVQQVRRSPQLVSWSQDNWGSHKGVLVQVWEAMGVSFQ